MHFKGSKAVESVGIPHSGWKIGPFDCLEKDQLTKVGGLYSPGDVLAQET